MKSTLVKLILAMVSTVGVMLATTAVASGAAYDFVAGTLRVDLPAVANAQDYRVYLNANGTNNAPSSDFTTVWIGFDLNPCYPDQYHCARLWCMNS